MIVSPRFISDLKRSLERGVRHLSTIQAADGSFMSLSADQPQNFAGAVQFHSVFSTTLILQNLTFLSVTPTVAAVKKAITSFLLAQKSAQGSWNYWARDAEENKKLPYPDDLDDTFCALSGLMLADEALITGEVLAQVSQLLTALEVAEGGPYRTWLTTQTSDPVWTDVDLIVNSNIAYFLSLQGIVLPKLRRLFHQAVQTNMIQSPYYPVRLPLLFFLSRVITTAAYVRLLRQAILEELSKTTEPLYVALGVIALLNGQYPVAKVARYVAQLHPSQAKNGSWPAATFYTGVNPTGNGTFYAGSVALTTSYCLAALACYQSRVGQQQQSAKAKIPAAAVAIEKSVVATVQQRFALLGSSLQPVAQAAFTKIIERDRDKQIVLLPYFFRAALGKNGVHISDEVIVKLATASVYGWIAYTIYDDFLDAEAQLVTLPLANVCLRELTQIFLTVLPNDAGFMKLFHQVMDRLESTNAWEVSHCRFVVTEKIGQIEVPEYGDYAPLADRSLGHALGSLALLRSTSHVSEAEVTDLLQFYQHFLIARQLNDDAHDWQKDLAAGQCNSAGALILAAAKKQYVKATIAEVETELQQLFWYTVVDRVCELIEHHVTEAIACVKKMTVVADKMVLLQLVEKQLQPVLLIRKEKTQALAFLKTYEGGLQNCGKISAQMEKA